MASTASTTDNKILIKIITLTLLCFDFSHFPSTQLVQPPEAPVQSSLLEQVEPQATWDSWLHFPSTQLVQSPEAPLQSSLLKQAEPQATLMHFPLTQLVQSPEAPLQPSLLKQAEPQATLMHFPLTQLVQPPEAPVQPSLLEQTESQATWDSWLHFPLTQLVQSLLVQSALLLQDDPQQLGTPHDGFFFVKHFEQEIALTIPELSKQFISRLSILLAKQVFKLFTYCESFFLLLES